MKIKSFFYLVALTLLFISCKNQGEIYNEFENFSDNNRWEKKDIKKFSFTVSEPSKYNCELRFRHIYGFQFETIPLQIIITSPTGKQEKLQFDLQIKDASGKDKGECTGDICDLSYIFKKETLLEQGNYSIEIMNEFNHSYVPNVLGVGVKVFQSGNNSEATKP